MAGKWRFCLVASMGVLHLSISIRHTFSELELCYVTQALRNTQDDALREKANNHKVESRNV